MDGKGGLVVPQNNVFIFLPFPFKTRTKFLVYNTTGKIYPKIRKKYKYKIYQILSPDSGPQNLSRIFFKLYTNESDLLRWRCVWSKSAISAIQIQNNNGRNCYNSDAHYFSVRKRRVKTLYFSISVCNSIWVSVAANIRLLKINPLISLLHNHIVQFVFTWLNSKKKTLKFSNEILYNIVIDKRKRDHIKRDVRIIMDLNKNTYKSYLSLYKKQSKNFYFILLTEQKLLVFSTKLRGKLTAVKSVFDESNGWLKLSDCHRCVYTFRFRSKTQPVRKVYSKSSGTNIIRKHCR